MPTIFDIADYFLSMNSMTHKKLQKLCYYAQAWHLALNDERLFNSEFEAWIHGPVCPELYHEFKSYGYNKIPQNNRIPTNIQNDPYVQSFIQQVFEVYGNFSGNELEEISHSEDPWINARGNLGDWQSCNNVIRDEDMRRYYHSKYYQED